MIEDLNFLGEGRFTRRDDFVILIAERLRESPRTPWGSVSEYVNGLKLDETHKYSLFRKRTASEILRSGFVTGCTDEALAFIILSRELGIPTIYVETLNENWLKNPESNGVSGHVFVNIPFRGDWKVYDLKRGFTKDNDYTLGGERYIEIGKGLDFSEIHLKEKNGYESKPVSVQALKDLRKFKRVFWQ